MRVLVCGGRDFTNREAAGPIRNEQMIISGKPNLVLAFPGGKGTADMIRQAKAHGIPLQFAKTVPHF